jgi:hypothetical protein
LANSHYFTVDTGKAKHLYQVKNDGTSVDKFVINLKKEFGDTFTAISIRGLSAGKNDFDFKQLPYGFKQIALYWENPEADKTKIREYYLKLYVHYDKFPLRICNMEWIVTADAGLEKGTETDFNFNRDKAFALIESFFKKHTAFFMVSVFCGILPQSSWSNRCYLKVILRLPVSGIDVFHHSGINNLTEFGQNFINDIQSEFSRIVDTGNYDLLNLFTHKKNREEVTRKAENSVRNTMGVKNVGDAFVNETLLANITKKMFPDTIRQYHPQWLGKFILDIYVPSLNLAIEYHGEQHYKPIKRFGGEEKLERQKARDEHVRMKCKEFNIVFLEWPYTRKVTEKTVYEIYSQIIDLTNYKFRWECSTSNNQL